RAPQDARRPPRSRYRDRRLPRDARVDLGAARYHVPRHAFGRAPRARAPRHPEDLRLRIRLVRLGRRVRRAARHRRPARAAVGRSGSLRQRRYRAGDDVPARLRRPRQAVAQGARRRPSRETRSARAFSLSRRRARRDRAFRAQVRERRAPASHDVRQRLLGRLPPNDGSARAPAGRAGARGLPPCPDRHDRGADRRAHRRDAGAARRVQQRGLRAGDRHARDLPRFPRGGRRARSARPVCGSPRARHQALDDARALRALLSRRAARFRTRPREARRRALRRRARSRVRALRSGRGVPRRRARVAARRQPRAAPETALRPRALGGEYRHPHASAHGRRARRDRERTRAMAPELTVGLIVRDDPDGLVRSAASVLGQSWRGRTLLIIVDDGSSDETPDVAARLAARTGSVEMLRHERPAGFARARNRILDAARSRYVAWIDAGDVWHPRKLERQLRALEAARGASRVATCAAYSLAAGRASDETPQRSAHAAASPEIDLAPFSTLLGETAAFAAAGRLDESLHSLADEEFLRRMTAGGASLLLVEPETPLCALGARSERGAGVAGPADAPPTKRRPGARQRYAAFVRRAGATLLAANPLDPAHPAVVALVDLLTGSGRARLATFAPGLAALTAPAGPASPDADGPAPLTRIDRSVLTVVHACCAAGKLDRAEALLDAHRRRLGGRVHPRVIERLAAGHLAAGRAERAEAELVGALRRGIDDPALHLALADTYVRQGRWSEAIAHWERAPDTCRLDAGTGLATRIARAYREVGRPRDGWMLASRAAQRAPHDPALLHELDVCARRAADWPACLVCADTGASAGRVDAWGFLAGGNAPLTGRLASAPSAEIEIRLRVNGLPVAATRAAVVDDSIARFALNCAGLLDYLGDGDLLDVVAGDERVELPGGAASVMVHNGLPSRFAALERKLRQGYVFTKTGRLEAGHTEASKRAALELYLEVTEYLETETR